MLKQINKTFRAIGKGKVPANTKAITTADRDRLATTLHTYVIKDEDGAYYESVKALTFIQVEALAEGIDLADITLVDGTLKVKDTPVKKAAKKEKVAVETAVAVEVVTEAPAAEENPAE